LYPGKCESSSEGSRRSSSSAREALVDLFVESAEEDEDGKDAELPIELAKTKISSVPARFDSAIMCIVVLLLCFE
jgi:hypothetical protein